MADKVMWTTMLLVNKFKTTAELLCSCQSKLHWDEIFRPLRAWILEVVYVDSTIQNIVRFGEGFTINTVGYGVSQESLKDKGISLKEELE